MTSSRPAADKNRVRYERDGLQEWFINDGRGLEQGFTVHERPAGAGSLRFDLAVRGGLKPRVTPDAVSFVDQNGAEVVRYGGLKAWDADGKLLAVYFEPAGSPAGSMVRLTVEERGARYPVTVDPIAQQAYLKASNTGAGDLFGFSVAVSGDTVVVGAPGEDSSATGVNGNQADNSAPDSGAAYVFTLAPANTAPAITPLGVTRMQGSSGSALIATVNDAEDAPGLLAVSVQSANPSNGVTVSAISNIGGNVTADVAAQSTATSASFTLRVTDSGGATAEGTLNVTVTPNAPSASAAVGTSQLWPPNGNLINVGLAASATGNCSPVLQIRVYANEDDQTETSAGVVHSPDAKDIGSGTLRLRAERVEGAGGRVYLIVVTATDTGGNVGLAVATVVVPESASANHVNLVNSKAASARAYTLANHGAPPPGYFVVGDGPAIGPKQ